MSRSCIIMMPYDQPPTDSVIFWGCGTFSPQVREDPQSLVWSCQGNYRWDLKFNKSVAG